MVDSMEIDSPSESLPLKPRDRIIKRLVQLGVPGDQLDQPGLVAFVKDNREWIPEIVSAILPTEEVVGEAIREPRSGSKTSLVGLTMKARFRESMLWLQWLMFEGEPVSALKKLSKMNGQRGVCGAVWGNNDIAYRCRTCEHDPTCAICVPCFENGNHAGHDYSVIYTGGGCCDCGDVTAWKREGFCSKHKGAEQIQPLLEDLANSIGPILNALFTCWKNKLLFAQTSLQEIRASDIVVGRRKVANELTFVVVEMLLEFCNYSESLLSFVAKLLLAYSGLLDILVRAERFLIEDVTKKLHELLLKLLAEPIFKHEFAKVFLAYYPSVINEAIKECSDGDEPMKKYPLVPSFSVQIFTVPTLTPYLVKEMNLLGMLLECLGEIFISSSGDEGRLQLSRLGNLYETVVRVLQDIRFAISHAAVPKYVTCEQQDISRTWMRLMTFVQGFNPQKRETGIHIEEENDNMHLPFVLCHSIATIHSLLVDGAFSDINYNDSDGGIPLSTSKQDLYDEDGLRQAKVGQLTQVNSVCSEVGSTNALACTLQSSKTKVDVVSHPLLPPSITWLTCECLRAIDSWLGVGNISGALPNVSFPNSKNISVSNFPVLKIALSKITRGKYIFGRLGSSSKDHGMQCSSNVQSSYSVVDKEKDKNTMQCSNFRIGGDIDLGDACSSTDLNDSTVGADCAMEIDSLQFLSLSDWPEIIYDIGTQEISVHIMLHRLLSLLLQEGLRRTFGESTLQSVIGASSTNSLTTYTDFFGYALGGCHPYGFSAFLMEHPLRIRVFCAQVHAGMWRKNGDAALLSCEWYRSVHWSEQGLELDLFLLQCCAALAPADLYVRRILDRFGLSNYLSLDPGRTNEYEPVLVREMLTLIIQIVKERRFCGLSMAESLRRELVYKLAVGDATHSQLVKSLPRDLSKFEQLQEILDTVAVYSNPSGLNQGMYSLKWSFWKELDLYHPRWSLKDLQVAEERYLHFCSVSALTTQLPRWTKIYPPLKGVARIATCKAVLQIVRAVLFYAVFSFKASESRAPDSVLLPALHLLSLALDISFQQRESVDKACYLENPIPILGFAGEGIRGESIYDGSEQSLLSLLVLLMRMHKKENSDNFAESGSFDLSSMIERLLKKFADIDAGCMTKLQQLAPEVVSHLSKCVPDINLNISASASDSDKRKAKARERQAAILEKMRAQQSQFLASIDSGDDDSSQTQQVGSDSSVGYDLEESRQVVCSLCHDHNSKNPISFLTLLQKSRLVSFVDRGPLSWTQPHRSDKEHPPSTKNKLTDIPGMRKSSGDSGLMSSSWLAELVQNAVDDFASHGQLWEVTAFLQYVKDQFPELKNIRVPDTSNNEGEGISCTFETLEQNMYDYIHKGMHSNMPRSEVNSFAENISFVGGDQNRSDAGSVLLGKYIATLSRDITENPLLSENAQNEHTAVESTSQLTAYDGFGPMDSDGLHLSSCGHAVHQGCLDRYLSSLKERFIRRIVFEGGHIVDPDQGEFLCPVCRRLVNSVLPTLPGDLKKASRHTTSLGFGPMSTSSEDIYPLRLQQGLNLLQFSANVVGKDEILKAVPLWQSDEMRQNLEPFSRVLSRMYFPGKQEKISRSVRASPLMLLWDTLNYSIKSMEISARCGRNSLTPDCSLSALFEELKSSGGFTLSMLLELVHRTRGGNSIDVLRRFRGIQLFAASICSGVSMDGPRDSGMSGQGNMLTILKQVEMEAVNPDIQFWNRASDPVLAHDPFSSLMWTLFCLPCPFLSDEESMLSLVHAFYIVSVAQAVIFYCGKNMHDLNKLDIPHFLISDVYKVMGGSRGAQQFFVSNYFNSGVNIEDTIRSLSFPFLRRCALLWKIMYSSIPAPFHDEDHALDCSRVAIDGTMDSLDASQMEIHSVKELENMFKLPPIDVILKDKVSRVAVLKWLDHFSKWSETQSFQQIMHLTPAAPFELMRLPHVYQDLLQRYIKQRCPQCKSFLDEPALCLLCGKLCSPMWKTCCRESGCQTHAMACGAGTGVFLLTRRTSILLQRSARQAPWPSPYLDAFGEEDFEMHRGKPLYLNEERYAAITYMVASHGLDHNSKVLGQTTIGSFFMV